MSCWLWFLAGLFLGATLGAIFTALCIAASDPNDDDDELAALASLCTALQKDDQARLEAVVAEILRRKRRRP